MLRAGAADGYNLPPVPLMIATRGQAFYSAAEKKYLDLSTTPASLQKQHGVNATACTEEHNLKQTFCTLISKTYVFLKRLLKLNIKYVWCMIRINILEAFKSNLQENVLYPYVQLHYRLEVKMDDMTTDRKGNRSVLFHPHGDWLQNRLINRKLIESEDWLTIGLWTQPSTTVETWILLQGWKSQTTNEWQSSTVTLTSKAHYRTCELWIYLNPPPPLPDSAFWKGKA